MPIPQVQGDEALLPIGRHRASLAELRAYFVEEAPFQAERALIFQALEAWVALMTSLLPDARLWVDGGFVTHKPWAAPSDVDVMVLCQQDAVNALDATQQAMLESLLTKVHPGGARTQPMGGLVDGHLTVRGPTGNADYWYQQWARVKGSDGVEMTALKKGFVEVVP